MNQYSRLYQDLLDSAKDNNLTVFHVKSKNPPATLSISKKLIRIARSSKNTKLGCYLLAHELGHWKDFCEGKLNDWVYKGNRSIDLIKKVEWSATSFAKKVLLSRNICLKNFPETDRKFFEEELVPMWVKIYGKWKKSV